MTVQKEDIRKRLLQLQRELEETAVANEQSSAVVELDQSKVGRLSRMDAMQAQAMSQETGRRRRQHVQDIDAAIERVHSGEYGLCFECDVDIGTGRLLASPVATLCITCAEALE